MAATINILDSRFTHFTPRCIYRHLFYSRNFITGCFDLISEADDI
jgi:hypothetical protein